MSYRSEHNDIKCSHVTVVEIKLTQQCLRSSEMVLCNYTELCAKPPDPYKICSTEGHAHRYNNNAKNLPQHKLSKPNSNSSLHSLQKC